jgi:hypothetical protein
MTTIAQLPYEQDEGAQMAIDKEEELSTSRQ